MRLALILLGGLAIWAFDAGSLFAQAAGGSDWPTFDMNFVRGPGFYLSVSKIVASWLLFLLWVHTTDWVSQDCLHYRLNYPLWNSVIFGSFFAAFVLLWILPWFWLSYFLLLTAYIAPLTVFILQRNKQLDYGQRVMTPPHLRRWFAKKASKLGLSVAKEAPNVDSLGGNCKFKAMGGATERDDNVNLLTARQHPGYVPAKKVILAALGRRADALLLDYGAQIVTVRYQIDGVWHNQEPIQRAEEGDPLLVVLKTLAALKPADRRNKQSGTIGIETDLGKYQVKFASQGTQTGERVVLQFEGKKQAIKTFEEAGMRPKMQEQLVELLGQSAGLFIVSAMPAGGLSTTYDLTLGATDRFMRNFAAIEAEGTGERETLNVQVTHYNAAAGESPATVLPKLIRTYPDVFGVRDLVNLETLEILIGQINDEKRFVFTSVRAKEAVEALLRILLLKVPPADLAKVVLGVLNVRLVRKLCEKCREAYPPPAEVLKQMGVPAGRIEAFYRPPTKPIDPKHPEVVCDRCHGVGYEGRMGIFELLIVDDRLRQTLATQPKLETLRDAARKSKHRSLQDEGLLAVARGITSLQELLRVLKQ